MRRTSSGSDRGAVAVEFALVLPLLLLLLLLMVDLGRLMFVQISLNSAAKESVRALALGKLSSEDEAAFISRVIALGQNSATGASQMAHLGSGSGALWVCGSTTFTRNGVIDAATCATPTRCLTAGTAVSITTATTFHWITPPIKISGTPIDLTDYNIKSKAVSLCLSV